MPITTRPDLEYARPDGEPLLLDLYLPSEPKGAPLITFFHGGGWIMGDRKMFAAERLEKLAELGVAVASVDYRYSSIAKFPAQIHDAKAAIRWLRANGSEFGLDTDFIGAWGASAGGYLASMLGVTTGRPEFEGDLGDHPDASSDVQAVVDFFGPKDLLRVTHKTDMPKDLPLPPFMPPGLPEHPSMSAMLLGIDRVEDDLEAVKNASIGTWVSSDAPPFLLAHGDSDGVIYHSESVRFNELLVDAGVESLLLLVKGANHEGPEFNTPALLGAVANFFHGQAAAGA
jgi:acetyl esterase/lipase